MHSITDWLDRFCYKHPRLGIPNLMMYIVIGNIAVYLLDNFSGGACSAMLAFIPAGILRGQLWRLVTFIFVPASGYNLIFFALFLYVFTGCNVENSAYGDTICAERTAVVKAVSEGHRDDFVRIAIAGNSKDYCWPCGSCRQVLFEFAPDLEVLIAKEGGDYVKLSLQALLAHGFGPKALL